MSLMLFFAVAFTMMRSPAFASARIDRWTLVRRANPPNLLSKIYIFSDNAQENRLPVTRPAHSGVGAIGVLSNHRATYLGNAVLIGPCHLLTVAHVAFSTLRELRHPSSKIHSMFEIGQESLGSRFMDRVEAWPIAWGHFTVNRLSEVSSAGDWAVLRLQSCIGLKYGYMRLQPIGLRQVLGRYRNKMSSAGYDGDHRMIELRQVEECSIQGEPKAGTWSHDCSESSGSSGEPLFYIDRLRRDSIVALDQGEFGPEHGEPVKTVRKKAIRRFFNYSLPVSTFYGQVIAAVRRDRRQTGTLLSEGHMPVRSLSY